MPSSLKCPFNKTLLSCVIGIGVSFAIPISSTVAQTAEVKKDERKNDQPSSTNERNTRLNAVKITADAEESSSANLEYINVENTTGALGNKTILDTPFSITTVDSEEIIDRGAKSLGQIFVNDASVYAPTPSSQTDWWGTQIRGLPVRNFYVDDVPMLLYWGGDFPTEAAQSVTALKGLTGFMYGLGEPGGAISYKIKRPTATPETFLNFGYRNASLLSVHFDTSQHISDDFVVRANLFTEQGTAYNEAEIDRTVAALSLDKNFGDSVTWYTSLVYEKNKNEAEPLQFYFSKYNVAGSRGKLPAINYNYDDFNIDNSYYDTETLIASTGVDWALNDNWELKYKLGFSRKEHYSNKSFAYLQNRAGDYEGYAYNFAGKLDNLFNQLVLQGAVTTGAIEHEIVGGIGVQKAEERWGTDWYWENDFNGNIHEEQTFRITRTPDFTLESKPSLESTQSYAFISDTIHFNEQWQTIIGVRFTDYELKDVDGNPAIASGYDTTEATPTVAIIYKPTAQTSFYGSYVQGVEPGVRVGPTYANKGDLLDATVSDQYEVGVKHAAGKLNYTAAIFRIERVNQMNVIRENILPYLTQDGLEIYQGLELSTSYQITDALNLGFSALYLDGTLDKVSADKAALKGNDPAYASDWQLVGNFEYQLASVEGLKLHGNIRYFGESYTSTDNNLELPAYTLVNTGASYDFEIMNQAWAVNANINNLLNEKYWAGGGWSSGNMGEERNISLGLNTKF
ncbi:MAG: TonB-dependent siderophore receptor [Cellvibrio sp. 79]|nr:MAG: TonB-dependent siderophore receptor [Cellvibrio sp. 79]